MPYELSVVLLATVLPAASVARVRTAGDRQDLDAPVARWFVFRGVGVRLTAGASQGLRSVALAAAALR